MASNNTLNPAPSAVELFEAMCFEDGVPAAVEAFTTPGGVSGIDPMTLHLAMLQVLSRQAFDVANTDDPFALQNQPFFTESDLRAAAGDGLDGGDGAEERARCWHDQFVAATGQSHAVVNQVNATRAVLVAHTSRFDTSTVNGQARTVRHPDGQTGSDVADLLAAELGLGCFEAQKLVNQSVWLTTHTPHLLADVAAGAANLAPVAAIATELQDASPATCELVQADVLARGSHCRWTTRQAGRCARTLVTKHESNAARVTLRKTMAQQTGVWLDPHPTPGLSMLTAVLPTADALAIKGAVEDHAYALHRDTNSSSTMTVGQCRAQALADLALRGVDLTLTLDVLIPTSNSASEPEVDRNTAEHTAREAVASLLTDDETATRVVAHHAQAGPIAVEDLRRLARWAKKITTHPIRINPATGELLDHTRTQTYRPNRTLTRIVRTRDQHCRFPGCERAARYNDIDHATPWPTGPTTDTNLHSLCRRHHQLKQTPGWHLKLTPNSDATWTTPTGTTITTHPALTETYWNTT